MLNQESQYLESCFLLQSLIDLFFSKPPFQESLVYLQANELVAIMWKGRHTAISRILDTLMAAFTFFLIHLEL